MTEADGTPTQRAVRLWLFDRGDWERALACDEARRALACDELARAATMSRPHARQTRLAGRLLCRIALAHETAADPGALRFTRGEFGRPELDPNPHGARFNVAHTAEMAVCLVTSGLECGVDVERVPADPDVLRVAPRFLAPDELQCLEHAPAAERPFLFGEYWVLREAYAKALGTGLTRPSHTFSFGWLPALPVAVRDVAHDDAEARRWRFAVLRPAEGLLLAVALRESPSSAPVRLEVVRIGRRDLAPAHLQSALLATAVARAGARSAAWSGRPPQSARPRRASPQAWLAGGRGRTSAGGLRSAR